MAKYESIAVFSLKQGEEKAKELVEKFRALIEANGTFAKREVTEDGKTVEADYVDVWGTRKLAYPINYEEDGYYVLYVFESDVDFPAELDRVFNITDGVLRHLVIAR